jgi:hypothetical protein
MLVGFGQEVAAADMCQPPEYNGFGAGKFRPRRGFAAVTGVLPPSPGLIEIRAGGG